MRFPDSQTGQALGPAIREHGTCGITGKIGGPLSPKSQGPQSQKRSLAKDILSRPLQKERLELPISSSPPFAEVPGKSKHMSSSERFPLKQKQTNNGGSTQNIKQMECLESVPWSARAQTQRDHPFSWRKSLVANYST